MFAAATDDRAFRRHFRKHIVLPVVALGFVVLLAAAFGLHRAVTESDRLAVARQTELIGNAIAAADDQLATELRIFAEWEQLSEQLARQPLDTAWFDREIGSLLREAKGQDMLFILGPGERPVYSHAGTRLPASAFAAIAPSVRPLVEAALAGTWKRDARPRGAEERANADLIEIAGRPAATSATMVRMDGARGRPGWQILVSVRFMDRATLDQIGARSRIDGLRFSRRATAAADEAMMAFKDNRGRRIGYLFWRADPPGSRIVRALVPVATIMAFAVLGTLTLLLRLLWKSGRRLASTVVDLQASEAHAQHLAFHDVLTGLPNRALFQDRLEQALACARRGQPCAVLALDLDRFKQVNDTLGHAAGDALIREFATRLSGVLRSSDTVARLGGDEFCVVVCDALHRADLEILCERILDIVRQPFELLGNQAFVGVSIGVALAPEAGTDRGDLIRKADIALYQAKSEGRDRYRIFNPAMDASVRLRREIEDELRRAIAAGDQLRVHYQPEFGPNGNRIVGFEALLRWMHPHRGLITPEQFIPVAEETGLIAQLGDLVLEDACRLARQWPRHFFAVNLSPVQFRSTNLAARIIAIVARAGCETRQIELEITETILREDDDRARETLRELREAGFRIALDDFGTGYSSLSYLREFKVDKIKIDRSFTHNLGRSAEAAAIVTSVVTLGHAMGLTVTAEGVENRRQLRLLSQAGCNELQGYLFSQAIPADAIPDLLDSRVRLRDVA